MQIYLDYSATTPPRAEAIAAMKKAMEQQWGNSSSLHHWGNRAATMLERSRQQVADLINAANPASIVFTAGGSEANNLALFGVTRQFNEPQHLIVSAVEHSAVSAPASYLETKGWQVTRLPVNAVGAVDPIQLQAALKPNTALVSVIYGQSEVGTLQPIAEIADILSTHPARFHTDAVQVAGRLPINVQQLGVDFLSLSSHKIYGPQGAGALYIRENYIREKSDIKETIGAIQPIIFGGGQELGVRSGTQSIPNIVGFGVAAELAATDMPTETPRLIALRDRLFSLMASTSDLKSTGDARYRLPHHVSFCLPSVQNDLSISPKQTALTGKAIVRQMNLAGIGISAGSACHSGKLSPSPILKAMGYSDTVAKSGIRLTLGRQTTQADIDWCAIALKQILARNRPVPSPMAV
ncbi:MAG: cysteine desulfurase family protein [Cyanobacteria bacterium P01_D01_bin.105]